MIWFGYVAITILILSFPVIGIFMIWSALTGKGIEYPGRDSSFQFRVQYHLRGLIGLGFLIGGCLMLWEIIKEL